MQSGQDRTLVRSEQLNAKTDPVMRITVRESEGRRWATIQYWGKDGSSSTVMCQIAELANWWVKVGLMLEEEAKKG